METDVEEKASSSSESEGQADNPSTPMFAAKLNNRVHPVSSPSAPRFVSPIQNMPNQATLLEGIFSNAVLHNIFVLFLVIQ